MPLKIKQFLESRSRREGREGGSAEQDIIYRHKMLYCQNIWSIETMQQVVKQESELMTAARWQQESHQQPLMPQKV